MANKIVSINLDETTDKIRKKVPNFSLFVRQCLHRYSAQLNAQQESCQYNDSLELFDGKCNPLNGQRIAQDYTFLNLELKHMIQKKI